MLPSLKPEQMVGLLFVLVLHGIVLYGLWSYRFIPAPYEALTIMVNLINPPSVEPPKPPRPPKPVPPKPLKLLPPEPTPPEHRQLAVETPVVQPDEQVVKAAPPVINISPSPPQPVELSGELSVVCPKRSQPNYPSVAKRMNQQGKVLLRVELGEDGRVTNAEVKTSSGYRQLDDAALGTVKTWRCNPAMRNGVAVQAVALQQFSFILGE